MEGPDWFIPQPQALDPSIPVTIPKPCPKFVVEISERDGGWVEGGGGGVRGVPLCPRGLIPILGQSNWLRSSVVSVLASLIAGNPLRPPLPWRPARLPPVAVSLFGGEGRGKRDGARERVEGGSDASCVCGGGVPGGVMSGAPAGASAPRPNLWNRRGGPHLRVRPRALTGPRGGRCGMAGRRGRREGSWFSPARAASLAVPRSLPPPPPSSRGGEGGRGRAHGFPNSVSACRPVVPAHPGLAAQATGKARVAPALHTPPGHGAPSSLFSPIPLQSFNPRPPLHPLSTYHHSINPSTTTPVKNHLFLTTYHTPSSPSLSLCACASLGRMRTQGRGPSHE